jgi:hypothetical protein
MDNEFQTFLSFNDQAVADAVSQKLSESKIQFIVDKTKPVLDAGFVDSSLEQNIHIKLRPDDFNKAHQALEEYYQSHLDNAEEDYYLFSFSNDELKEIIRKPDEWGHYDFQLAKKLLKDRGDEIDQETEKQIKEERIKDLSKPEQASKLLLFFGYCFIPFGLIIGYLIGRHLFYDKRTLPNGESVYTYRSTDRKHGDRIMMISGLLFIVLVILAILLKIFGK